MTERNNSTRASEESSTAFVISLFLLTVFQHFCAVLSHNQIETIEVTTLRSLTKLQLSHNGLKSFPDINVSMIYSDEFLRRSKKTWLLSAVLHSAIFQLIKAMSDGELPHSKE